MKDWIMGLCPEIAEWQAELIEEQMLSVLSAEREAIIDIVAMHGGSVEIEAAIRARGEK